MSEIIKKKKPLPVLVKKKKKPALIPNSGIDWENITPDEIKAEVDRLIPAVNVEPAPAHALLSPSYSKTWLSCAAALAAGIDEPNVSGAAALEGTLCHQVLENVINRLIDPQCPLDCAMPAWAVIGATKDSPSVPYSEGQGRYQGQSATDFIGVAPLADHPKMRFTSDQAKLIQPFIDYIKGLMDAGYTVFPELRVDLSQVLNAPDTFGTADLIAFKDDHLIVGDLKMGRNQVSPGTMNDINPQMGLYGAGVLHKYSKTKSFKEVTLLIAQPRAGGLKFLDNIPVVVMQQFAEFARTRAVAAIECVSRGKKKLVAGDFSPTPGGCQWCRFRDKCSAKLKASTGVDEPTGTEISDAELLAAYEKLPLLESQIASTRAEMLKRLLAGRKIGDLKVVEGSLGVRKWASDSDAEAYLLGKLYAQAYEKKVISPTVAAKLLPDDKELNKLIVRAPGKPSIANGEDKRKAYEAVTNDDLSD